MHIAIDIGGTFTDVIGWRDGRLYATKVPSSRRDPIGSIRRGIEEACALAGVTPHAVTRFVHGTTVATNAVLQENGARIGLLATDGFEDVLEIGRQKRSRMYDLMAPAETPGFLAPKRRRLGIPERVAADGCILVPLDETAVRAAVRRLVDEHEVEALAVCYLFSFRNPAHELRTRELVAEEAPGLAVSLSCEVDPVFREYERTVVTAFDAYVRPVMTGYLGRLRRALDEIGVRVPVEMMQSRGAIASADRIVARPVASLLSGPAAGALGGAVAGTRAGFPNVIALDMGGTSTDVAVVRDGRLVATRESRIRSHPLRVQMVDVHTIGAGGGSIARVDAGGALKVGPESAEAEPGPACYGRGGVAPTVTDASLALGLLDAGSFAGGLALDREAALNALAPLAPAFGGSIDRAASGVLTVCNAAMAEAIRMVTVRRGIDPRGFALVLLGGAGPVHGSLVARALGIRTVVVPLRPGVLAAEGLLHAPVEVDMNRTFARRADDAACAELPALLADLARSGNDALGVDRPTDATAYVRYSADMRYVGQSYEMEVPLDPDRPETAVDDFRALYRQTYGHESLSSAVEFVNLRAVTGYRRPPPAEEHLAAGAAPQPTGTRPVCFDAVVGPQPVPVYHRSAMRAGSEIAGPAIVEQADTTVVVYPGQRCHAHDSGALVLTWQTP
jgi:N-methylhydantoinase A/oxoprolinase/acetone carboxylase beta subunit